MSITVSGVRYILPKDINKIADLDENKYRAAMAELRRSISDRMWESLLQDRREAFARSSAWAPVPPADPQVQWAKISGKRSPFPTDEGEDERKLFGRWFNYFWDEAVTVENLTGDEKSQLHDAFFAIFDASGNKPRAELHELDNDQLRNVLSRLLGVGFKRVRTAPGHLRFGNSVESVSGARLFAMWFQGMKPGAARLPIGFRGDKRSWDELKHDGGFLAKSRSNDAEFKRRCGLDRRWHPYTLGTFQDSMFLRRGQNKDNCVNAVVSVATTVAQSLRYPMLHDPSVFRLAKTPLNRWTPADIEYAKGQNLMIPPDNPKGILISPTYVYMLDMSGSRGFDTQAWQHSVGATEADERAADKVDPHNVLAVAAVHRKHFFSRGNIQWEMFELDVVKFRLLKDMDRLRFTFGELGPLNISYTFQRAVSQFQQQELHYAHQEFERL